MPNVIITPHVGAQAARRNDDATDLFCRNLKRYLTGKPLGPIAESVRLHTVTRSLGHFTIGGRYGDPKWSSRNAAVADLNGDRTSSA